MDESILSVEGLTKRYGAGETAVTAVRDVSMTVDRGEIVLIMGPSGSGKTTLLSMLGCLLRPSEGTITLAGQLVSSLPESRLPEVRLHRIGFIFQDFNLLAALSARDNVAIVAELAASRRRAAHRRAELLLADLGLGERLGFLPEQLSGGEKQRVAIARSLVNEPSLILADEPTANLDSKIGRDLMRLLRRVTSDQGRSAVIVSHDQRIRDIADRVLWLEDGQLATMSALPIDPVCGMAVEQSDAPTTDWQGQRLTFCSIGCMTEFLANPAQFLPSMAEA
jgi:putative ABC transport system ATP-binding protein